MRKDRKIRKEKGEEEAPKPNLEEGEEEARMASMKKKQRRKERNHAEIMPSSPCASAAKAPILQQEEKVTKKRKRRMEQEPSGNSPPSPLYPGDACDPSLQSPAPEILTLAEAAAMMRKRNMHKEHKVDALPFAPNHPTLEEQGKEKKKKKKERKRVEQILPSPSTSVAAETPIQEQEVNVIKKQKKRRGQEPSGKSQEPSDNLPLPLHPGHVPEPLLAASLLQSPAPEILTLEQAAAMMRRRKMPKEQKVDALLFAPNPTLKEHGEEAMMATKKKKKRKCREQILSSPFTSVAAETPIQEQEVKVTKKRKQRRGLEPSGNSCHPGHASKPLLAAPILQSPAPEIITLGEAAAAVAMGKRKMCKEQKVAALSFAQNPTLEEEQGEEAMTAMTKKERKPVEQILSSPTTIAAETPIQEQEVNVIKKHKRRRGQEPSGKSHEPSDNLPLALHPGHVSEPLLAASLLQSPAPEILTLEEAAAMMRRRKMRKEQKVDVLPSAQNPTLVDHGEEAMMETKKKKKCKCVEQIFSSPSTSVAAETPIQEQEVKVTKKQRQRRKQEPSGKSESPLPLHPGHASKRILAAPFLQSPAPEILTLGDAGVAVTTGKRKMRKEQKVAALSFAQNPTLEEQQGEEAMTATTKKERKRVEQILSSPTFVAAETPVQEQEVKVTKKQKQGRGQEPSSKSTLPLDPGQSRCVQSQGAKTPPEQEGENDGFKGIKKSNGKKPPVRVHSNRELIQEARKQPQPLPEGFVPFSNFVASCTEQNADHSSPYSAFFDQFRYNPVREDRKPPLPRTPDCLARLPPRGHSSFESSQLAANEASRPDTTLASKTKQQDSGSGSKAFKANNSLESKSKNKDSGSGSTSGSQKKQNVKEKTTPEKKTRIRKPRPVFSTAEKRSDKYRRVPLDQLVAPPCSPHNLLQEKYASDPWKVILICMFLNLTQGIQVKRILEGFFERYPDPWSAIDADPDKMAEYLSPLGLQHVRTRNIKKLSKQYVGNEWTHITQLCGVGKYAADAYAIFCAGRAREVVPDDHKLVDYWNYVCFELPMTQMD